MAVHLEISLDKEISELKGFFDDIKFKAVVVAARQALNKTATDVKGRASRSIRKRRNLLLRDVRKRIEITRARGSDLSRLESRVDFSDIPLPLILFLVGNKKPKAQTKANADRTPRTFQIVKGHRKREPGLFVEKAKHGGMQYQVFRRGDPSNRSEGFKAQSVPSIAHLLSTETRLLGSIEREALRRLSVEFSRALRFQLLKLKF